MLRAGGGMLRTGGVGVLGGRLLSRDSWLGVQIDESCQDKKPDPRIWRPFHVNGLPGKEVLAKNGRKSLAL